MRRLSYMLIFTGLVLLSGVCVSLWLGFSDHPTADVPKTEQEKSKPVLKLPPYVEGFNYIGTDWMMATSGCFPIYYYQTADGTKISVTDNIYETPEEAKQDIQEFIRRAKRVIEQSLVIDENGDQIGERVIVQVQARLPYEKPAQLIWTEGRRWFKVEGRTAEQLLAFESRYKATK